MPQPFKVFIAGAGPAGLYAGYLIKRARPEAVIAIVEQNAPDATFGFGVVFSDKALDLLAEDDPETHATITPAMETWPDLTLDHRGQRITIDGIGFAAIGRLALLRLLQARAASVGIVPQYGVALTAPPNAEDFDLVIAADGLNSVVRRAHDFGTTITPMSNHFAWYGTRRRFETLTQTFVDTDLGRFNAHHYRYAPDASTFIVECDDPTWQRAGFSRMSEDDSRRTCERLFADALDGRPLVSNKSVWRNFPRLRNAWWSLGNTVLVGDALRTAHFSIGSGTRLALEDVVALVKALRASGFDVASALADFERRRRPIVDKLVAAADASALWYEHYASHMDLEPAAFAWSYIQRTGRVDPARVERLSPRFLAACGAPPA